MTADTGTMSEQVSLHAQPTGDPAWLDRFVDDDPVAHLGETFVLNGLVQDQAVRHTRLIAPDAIEQVATWLAETLAEEHTGPEQARWEDRAALTRDEARRLLDLDTELLPAAYRDWRWAIEVYAVVGDIAFLLLDRQFVRYRRLSRSELGMLFSPRVAPFATFDDQTTGTAVLLGAVPNRGAALGGLRGYRRALISAGEALAGLDALWAGTAANTRWVWEREFLDDACAQVFGLDGLERVPLALAYQQEAP